MLRSSVFRIPATDNAPLDYQFEDSHGNPMNTADFLVGVTITTLFPTASSIFYYDEPWLEKVNSTGLVRLHFLTDPSNPSSTPVFPNSGEYRIVFWLFNADDLAFSSGGFDFARFDINTFDQPVD